MFKLGGKLKGWLMLGLGVGFGGGLCLGYG